MLRSLEVLLGDGFTRGFLVGQLIALITLLFLIRYFLLGSPPSYLRIRPRPRSRLATHETLPDGTTNASSIDAILSRLGLADKVDLDESCGWLNLLLARLIFSQINEDEGILEKAVAKLEDTIATLTPFIVNYIDVCGQLTV